MTSAQLNRTQAGVLLSVAAFRAWLVRARPGERFEYYRGHLGIDRVKATSSLKQAERGKLAAVADHTLALAGRGELHLLQERHGDSDYSYLAVARVPSGSVVARMRLPAIATPGSSQSPRTRIPRLGPRTTKELSMASHLLEREEVAQ